MTATSQSPLTLRWSRLISSADYDPVCRCVCVVFRLFGDNGGAPLHARFSFLSPGMLGFLSEPIDSWHVSKMLFSAREHLASHWLDLAEGRLRLDRLNRNGGGETFFPWASPIPRAGQESLAAAILRCAAARVGAASIAFGFQIAIEAAVVARLENSKEK